MAQTISGNGVIDIKNQAYVIKGGKGDDTIIGGNGNDTITGGKGTNTFIYSAGDGNDVYNLTKGENLILQLEGVTDVGNVDFGYAENKKDLLVFIDRNNPNEYITIKNFVEKEYTNSAVIRVGENDYNIKELTFETQLPADYKGSSFKGTWLNDEIDASEYYVEGQTAEDKGLVLDAGNGVHNQQIVGSQYSDTIYAGKITEPINFAAYNYIEAGAGNDVIVCAGSVDRIAGGEGNDTITGGTGYTEIFYFAGDGHDVVNLTKGEQFKISFIDSYSDYLYGKYSQMPNLGYESAENGKDLIIWVDKNNHDAGSITIKNFMTKDITNNATKKKADTSFVNLYYADAEGNEVAVDLRKDIYVLTKPDKNFTGTWLNDEIDARNAVLKKTVKIDGKKVEVDKADTDKGLTLNGGAGNDIIIGTRYSDTLKGGDGDDVIKSVKGYGNDVMYGGNGNDTISGGIGNDKLYGDNGDDSISGSIGNDTIYGGNGNDSIDGGNDDDKLYGDAGNDTIQGGGGNDTIYGGKGDDSIEGGNDDDLLYGDDGNDYIDGGNGNDTIYGGKGNDSINGGNGDDVLYGGDGDDTLIGGSGIDTYYGGNGNDYIKSVVAGEYADGGAGDDYIEISGGTAVGGKGNDTIIATSGEGIVKFDAKSGHDTYINFRGNANDTLVFDGISITNLSFEHSDDDLVIKYNKNTSVTVQDYYKEGSNSAEWGTYVQTKDGGKELLSNIIKAYEQGHIGTAKADKIESSGGGYYFTGAGNDVINVSGSNPAVIYAGAGNDKITASGGQSVIYAGAGNDTITSSGANSTVYGGTGNDVIYTQRYASDYLVFNNGDGKDVIYQLKDNLPSLIATTKEDIIELTGVDRDGFGVTTKGNDIIISYNANKKGKYQDSITLKDYLKDEDNSRDITIKTNDGKESSLKGILYGVNIETSGANAELYGYGKNDTITASGGASTIYAGAGDDVITANGGASVVYGGEGNDTISSGDAKSTIYGGKGDDVIKTNSYIPDVLVFENGDGHDVIEETVKFSRNSEADTIMLMGVDKDGFTQAMNGNDLVISYNKNKKGVYQDTITIKDFLKNPDDIPNYKIVTNDGYESTVNIAALKEGVAGWLYATDSDDFATALQNASEDDIASLNAIFAANQEQIIPA